MAGVQGRFISILSHYRMLVSPPDTRDFYYITLAVVAAGEKSMKLKSKPHHTQVFTQNGGGTL